MWLRERRNIGAKGQLFDLEEGEMGCAFEDEIPERGRQTGRRVRN
jgi:hypothetical protein